MAREVKEDEDERCKDLRRYLVREKTEGRSDCICKAMHDMTWKSGVNDMNSEVAKSNRSHGGRLCKSDLH
jgi:hypothetical protein